MVGLPDAVVVDCKLISSTSFSLRIMPSERLRVERGSDTYISESLVATSPTPSLTPGEMGAKDELLAIPPAAGGPWPLILGVISLTVKCDGGGTQQPHLCDPDHCFYLLRLNERSNADGLDASGSERGIRSPRGPLFYDFQYSFF